CGSPLDPVGKLMSFHSAPPSNETYGLVTKLALSVVPTIEPPTRFFGSRGLAAIMVSQWGTSPSRLTRILGPMIIRPPAGVDALLSADIEQNANAAIAIASSSFFETTEDAHIWLIICPPETQAAIRPPRTRSQLGYIGGAMRSLRDINPQIR